MRFLLIIFFLLMSHTVTADIYSYVDKNGKQWFVDNKDSVPDQYKDQLNEVFKTPKVQNQPTSKKVQPTETKADIQARNERIRQRRNQRKAEQGEKTVEIYVTSWCPHCRKLENFLKKQKIKYSRFDIERDASAKQRHLAMGGGGIPVTKIGDQVIRGNNPQAILSVLGK